MLRKGNLIQIDTLSFSLLLDVSDGVKTLYCGGRLADSTGWDVYCKAPRREAHATVDNLDVCNRPFSFFGEGNDKEPFVLLQSEKSGFVSKFAFKTAEIQNAKPQSVLPQAHTFDEVLRLEYADEVNGVALEIFIACYKNCDALTFSSRVKNLSGGRIRVHRLFSAQLDVDCCSADIVTLDGAWASERQLSRQTLSGGTFFVDSKLGSSSCKHNPFVAVTPAGCGYTAGFNPVYSGNHKTLCELSPLGQARILSGMNDFCLSYPLEGGEYLDGPEVAVALGADLGAVTRQMHAFVNAHIVPPRFQSKPRPVLLNNWEATYYDFEPQKLHALAEKASALGVELFVLDDGWFGGRENEKTALGDWYDNPAKTGGLDRLAQKVRALGMEFGLWVEPEMLSRDSELYRRHPEYAMRVEGAEPIERRNQLMLDLCNENARRYVVDSLCAVIELARPAYIKWDCNRVMTDAFSRAAGDMGKYFYDYTAALYAILRELTRKYPEILFEACSAGGNRYDLGMLCFMPQVWASDNTDARCRVDIQLGTLTAYPQSTMGAHVSASPNHQTGMVTPLTERFIVACGGLLGYELDVTKLSPQECAQVKRQIEFYKAHRQLLQFGEYALLQNDNYVVQTLRGAREMVASFIRRARPVNRIGQRFALKGLDEAALYEVSVFESDEKFTASGAVLCGRGLELGGYFKDNAHNAISAFMLYLKRLDG